MTVRKGVPVREAMTKRRALRVRGAVFGIREAFMVSLLLLGGPGASPAQEPRLFARASLSPEGVLTVGQPVELQVEVFVSTWFTRAPEFPTLDLERAVVTPPGRSTNLNQRVGGLQYFGIRRAYTLYPQAAGTYQIPALTLTVRPGGSDDVVNVSTEPLAFEARIPPEAAGLGYFIGTPRLTLAQSVEPAVDTLKVGDALTRTVEMTVVDALSMVLPPLSFDTVPGLAVYPEPPVVTDEGGERGTQRIGRRIESATYVLGTEGVYDLPAVEIAWWDLGAQRLRRTSVPAVRFVVEADPAYAPAFVLPPDPDSLVAEAPVESPDLFRRTATLALGFGLVLVALLWGIRRLGPIALTRVSRWRRARRDSEAARFARFRKACRKNDPALALRSLLSWLDHLAERDGAATLGAFVAAADDPELASAIRELEERLFGPGGSEKKGWVGSRLHRSVRRQRHRRRSATRARGRPPGLAPLNPGVPPVA